MVLPTTAPTSPTIHPMPIVFLQRASVCLLNEHTDGRKSDCVKEYCRVIKDCALGIEFTVH